MASLSFIYHTYLNMTILNQKGICTELNQWSILLNTLFWENVNCKNPGRWNSRQCSDNHPKMLHQPLAQPAAQLKPLCCLFYKTDLLELINKFILSLFFKNMYVFSTCISIYLQGFHSSIKYKQFCVPYIFPCKTARHKTCESIPVTSILNFFCCILYFLYESSCISTISLKTPVSP